MKHIQDHIDWKGGTFLYGSQVKLDIVDLDDPKSYWGEEDLLMIDYGSCLIDLGYYGNSTNGCFSITALEKFDNEKDQINAWDNAIKIPCADADDMLKQLQRAIDVYPSLIQRWKKGS